MLKALARRRGLIAATLILVTSAYGSIVVFVGDAAARTLGIGYCAVMVTIGMLLRVCDVAGRDPRRRRREPR
jgi:hypothetical protein